MPILPCAGKDINKQSLEYLAEFLSGIDLFIGGDTNSYALTAPLCFQPHFLSIFSRVEIYNSKGKTIPRNNDKQDVRIFGSNKKPVPFSSTLEIQTRRSAMQTNSVYGLESDIFVISHELELKQAQVEASEGYRDNHNQFLVKGKKRDKKFRFIKVYQEISDYTSALEEVKKGIEMIQEIYDSFKESKNR